LGHVGTLFVHFNGNLAQFLCLPFSASGVHKSQGSEFPAVVIPLATQHYMLLQRNLIYTGITRGKRLLVQKKALGIAVRNDRPQRRYSGLLASLKVPSIDQMCPLTRK
jgi:exodeoxyribonuclease V alpha subunit